MREFRWEERGPRFAADTFPRFAPPAARRRRAPTMPRHLLPAAFGSAVALFSLSLAPTVGLGQSYGLSEPNPGGYVQQPPPRFQPQQTQPRYVQPGQPQNQVSYPPQQARPTGQPPQGRTTYRPAGPSTSPPPQDNMPPGAVPHYRQSADGRLIPDGYTLNGVKYPGGGGTRPTPGTYPGPTPGPYPNPSPPFNPNGSTPRGYLGVMATMMYGSGLRIDSVNPGSAAERMGLETGDVILGVNGTAVRSIDQFQQNLGQSGGHVNLTVRNVRNGEVINVPGFLTSGGQSGPQPTSAPPQTGGYQPGQP